MRSDADATPHAVVGAEVSKYLQARSVRRVQAQPAPQSTIPLDLATAPFERSAASLTSIRDTMASSSDPRPSEITPSGRRTAPGRPALLS